MSGHRPFSDLTKDFSPERKAKIAALVKKMQLNDDLLSECLDAFEGGKITKEEAIDFAQHRIALYERFIAHVESLPGNEWQDPFGAWSDLPDTMLDELAAQKHDTSPPLTLDFDKEE